MGAERAKALPAFHAFTGADIPGRFSRIGKATWLQVYMKADRDVVSYLLMLATEAEVIKTMLTNLASFVCAALLPNGIYINTIFELRWHLFCKHMAESDKLPESLQRIQSVGTGQHCSAGASVGSSSKWLPHGVRWSTDTRCRCKADRSSVRCSCRANNLSCTDLCQ